jgi:transcription antitermination factor NusG
MPEIYVLKVVIGKEDIVADSIRKTNPDVTGIYCPKDCFGAPLMPGYLFLEMAEMQGDVYRPVMDLPFALYYLCPASGLRSLEQTEAHAVSGYACARLAKGTPVYITGGPLKGLSGALSSICLPCVVLEADVYGEPVSCRVSIKHICLPDFTET